jgi:thiamine-phosphate pyrophosphorylase
MRHVDFSLYLVTNRQGLIMDDFLKIIRDAVEGGVKVVQLREKGTSFEEILEIGQKVQALLKPKKIPLIINDHIDIALALKADGVHLGRADRKVQEARKILGKNAIVGLSVETVKQVVEAAESDIDYVAASPVFPSPTKPDCYNPWGLSGLKYICSISRHPVIAVGGINETNVKEVMECKAKGVAVISAIFNAPCAKEAALKLSSEISKVHY